MSYIFLDLETNGLPEKAGWGKYFHFKDVTKYNNCRILSICIYIYTKDGKEIDQFYSIIKPDDFKVQNEHIHGLTESIVQKEGKKWEDIIRDVKNLCQKGTVIIGHNVDFDIHVLASELYRRGYEELSHFIFNKERFCTMLTGKNITKIKGNYDDYKFPKLSELYQYLFNEEMKGAHNAEEDVKNCAKCYFKMNKVI